MERELLLLGLLRRQDMHGYKLHEFIDSTMAMCVDLKKSTAYYLLDKMEKAGLVAQSTEQIGNRPLRRVYTLTDKGEARFQELLRDNLRAHLPARFNGDIGLAFLDELPATEAISLLEQRRSQLVAVLEEAQATPSHQGSLQFVVEHQRFHLESELDWLDTVLARLTRKADQKT